MKPSESKSAAPPDRRRFLRAAWKHSLPVAFGWIVGQARDLAQVLETPPRKTSPPPHAQSDLPAEAKQAADRHYDDFARDNPASPDEPYVP